MNKVRDCMDKADWHDVARLAQRAGLSPGAVRYHWNLVWQRLDLPPSASGYIDGERAARLLNYIAQVQQSETTRRRAFGKRVSGRKRVAQC